MKVFERVTFKSHNGFTDRELGLITPILSVSVLVARLFKTQYQPRHLTVTPRYPELEGSPEIRLVTFSPNIVIYRYASAGAVDWTCLGPPC